MATTTSSTDTIIDEGATDYSCPGRHPDRDAPGQPVWCRPCQDRIIDALRRLDTHVTDLATRGDGRVAATGGAVQYEGEAGTKHRAPGATTASPSPAWDNADKTIRHILTLETDLRHVTGDPDPERLTPATNRYRGDGGGTVARVIAFRDAIDYLTRFRAAFLSQPDAYTTGATILRMDRDLERLTGRDRLTHRLPVPCPTCEHLSLARDDGDDRIRCTRRPCGRVWRPDQYAWFAHVAAEGYAEDGDARA